VIQVRRNGDGSMRKEKWGDCCGDVAQVGLRLEVGERQRKRTAGDAMFLLAGTKRGKPHASAFNHYGEQASRLHDRKTAKNRLHGLNLKGYRGGGENLMSKIILKDASKLCRTLSETSSKEKGERGSRTVGVGRLSVGKAAER